MKPEQTAKTALLVINFGGPQTAAEVEGFLYELFADKDVIPLPGGRYVQELFADRVSQKRAPATVAQYAKIGGGSPLVPMTYAQAEAVHAELKAGGLEIDLFVGMRYTRPFIREALSAIRDGGYARLVCLALYPHYSFATTASSYNEVARQLEKLDMGGLSVHFIPAWHHDPDYLAALVDRIGATLLGLPEGAAPHLLFSAHGLPVSFIERGDPYQAHVQQSVRDAVRLLGWTGGYSLAYQSKVGRARWLGPSTDDELRRLGASGVEAVAVVPVSFVGEHIETLFELDLEYRHVAEEAGIRHYARVAALDTHPRFITALANQVRQALGQPTRACVRCLLPRERADHTAGRCPDCRFELPAYLKPRPADREAGR